MKNKIILSSILALSSGLFANIEIKSLDIYKNRVFINQEIDTNNSSVDLLGNVNFEQLRFLVDGSCEITNTKVKQNINSNDEISLQTETLKEKIAFKQNLIDSLNSSITSLENISFDSNAVNLQNIKEVNEYAQNQVENKKNQIFKESKALNKLKEELKKLHTKKNQVKHSKLFYSSTCSENSKVLVSYPFYNINKNSFYEINANTKNNSIDIKNRSFITQSSGLDFKNIDINLFSFNFTNSLNPITFTPEYLREEKENQGYLEEASVMMDSMMKKSAPKILRAKKSYSYNETQTKSFFKASNITLKTGDKTDVTFSNDSYESKSLIEIDGFGYAKPFYKLEFKANKLYSVQNSKLYLDGIFVGNYFQRQMKKNKKSSIYFGEDRLIDVKKELVKDMKENPFFAISKSKTQKLWKYTIMNNHKSKKTISLVERLPISTHEDIKVKLISNTKYTKKEDNNGKISYDFVLNPNEKKIIEFGYEIKRPDKK